MSNQENPTAKSNPGVCKFKSKIGGQALIEGVMMRGIDKTAMVCRLPSGKLDLEEWPIKNGKNIPWFRKVPFLRGIFNFIISLVEGYKCLSKSADKSISEDEDEKPAETEMEIIDGDKDADNNDNALEKDEKLVAAIKEAEKPSKFEAWLDKVFGKKLMPILTVIMSILGIVIAIGLFIYLPAFIVNQIDKLVSMPNVVKTITEGIVKIIIFICYIGLTGLMKDIGRTYEYHGAEHKTIACYEAGEELTVENVKKHTRFHPRCGTSFILIVLIVGIIVSSIFRFNWTNMFIRVLYKIAFLPVIVGIAYEFIRLAGKYENPFTKIFSAPGLMLQRLTTREPDDSEIECAIAAMNAVIPEDKEDDVW